MKIGIVIPIYINNEIHLEFTQETINSIQTSHEYQIYTIVNYCHPMYQSMVDRLPNVIHNPKGNILASAWNLGLELARKDKCDYVLYPNNDIVFHPKCIDNLVQFARENHQALMWTAAEHSPKQTLNEVELSDSFDEYPHFSCFMVEADFDTQLARYEEPIDPKLIAKLSEETGKSLIVPEPGKFDENYSPAYFEDGDMHNRILRAGRKALKTASALFYHYGSRTIKVDENLFIRNGATYDKNRTYFRTKWGWDPQTYHEQTGDGVNNENPIRFEYSKPFVK